MGKSTLLKKEDTFLLFVILVILETITRVFLCFKITQKVLAVTLYMSHDNKTKQTCFDITQIIKTTIHLVAFCSQCGTFPIVDRAI